MRYYNKQKKIVKELNVIKYDIEKFEVYREKLQKMNILELVDFLRRETEKIKFDTLIKLDIKNS